MKSQTGTKSPVLHHQESRWGKLKKVVVDLPLLAVAKTRSTLISPLTNISSRPSPKSILICFLVVFFGSFAILQVRSFAAGGHVVPPTRSLAARASNVIEIQWRHFFSLHDICLALRIGDDGDEPDDEALPYPLVSRLTDALKEEVLNFKQERWRTAQVLVVVDYGSIVCKIVRDTFAEVPGVQVNCREFPGILPSTTCEKLVVGSWSERFVPQLPKEWSQNLQSQSKRFVDLEFPDPSHDRPVLDERDWQPTVVTGFSSNHMAVGLLLLRSIGKAMEAGGGSFNISVVVWAMEAFDDEKQGLLDCVLAELTQVYGIKTEVRLFDWSAYPSWMRIDKSKYDYWGGTGEYAWKAAMVHTVLLERGMVLWTDAGDRFKGPDSLLETLKALNSSGFVSRSKDGNIQRWTHPLQIKYYRANYPEMLETENCVAAIIGFTLKKYVHLARPWYDCSMTRQCIAPDGSDRGNHRQDQAALTILSVFTKSPCKGAHPDLGDHATWEGQDSKLYDVSGTYPTKCYDDPLALAGQGWGD